MTSPIPRTLYAKIWDDHVVEQRDDGTALVWIDRHLTHEVTSPQAFDGLRLAGRPVHRPDLTLAVTGSTGSPIPNRRCRSRRSNRIAPSSGSSTSG
jgi:3-isopropylmalate/(R)-2-methylmalate dehydratase large subunit